MDQVKCWIMNPETFGQRIRQRRKALGLTQAELGRQCGKSESAVSLWESGGITDIMGTTLTRLARALQVSVDWLLYGEGDADQVVREAPLAEYWVLLTKRQQAQLEQAAQEMAEHNREVLELKRRND